MTSGNKKLAQKAVAVIVIVALLDVVGVSPAVVLFATGVVVVVWYVSRWAQTRELKGLFDFYVAADAILRDGEQRWFGFELAEVIEDGERALDLMPDSPPLHLFALGALNHRIGNYEATVEYLSCLMEGEAGEEQTRLAPSPQLRRYAAMLRQIEYNPSMAPLTLGAIRSLERARQKHASQLLAESRAFLKTGPRTDASEISVHDEEGISSSRSLSSITAPPPISEVLQDVYPDDTAAAQPPN